MGIQLYNQKMYSRTTKRYIVVQLKRVATRGGQTFRLQSADLLTRLSRAADYSRNLQETGFLYLIYQFIEPD